MGGGDKVNAHLLLATSCDGTSAQQPTTSVRSSGNNNNAQLAVGDLSGAVMVLTADVRPGTREAVSWVLPDGLGSVCCQTRSSWRIVRK